MPVSKVKTPSSSKSDGPWKRRVVLTFFLKLSPPPPSGMSLKEEQLSAIKAVYEGRA